MRDRQVGRNELVQFQPPRATETWFPVSHADVANTAIEKLTSSGFNVTKERWTLSNNENRVFGVIDLALPLADADVSGGGVSVSLGIRSSYDKKLPMGIVAGNTVFVCSNLVFAGELAYKRRHTRHGLSDFCSQLDEAILKLPQYRLFEIQRIQKWQNYEMTENQANCLLLALFESEIIGIRRFKAVMQEFRNPSFDDFAGKITLWTFFNRITTALRDRAMDRPLNHAVETSQLVQKLDTVVETTARIKSAENIILPLSVEKIE